MADDYEIRIANGDEAKRLLGDRVFNSVLKTLLADHVNELVKTMPGTGEATAVHAGIIALEDIKKRLRALENDGAMARHQRDKDARARGYPTE